MNELLNGRRRRWSLIPLFLVLVLGTALIVHTRRSLHAATTANVVYVETNAGCGKDVNAVFGWTNVGGKLSLISGEPITTGWLTGGTGVCDFNQVKGLTEFDADQQVIISPKSIPPLLFAVNSHSNTVAGFSIGAGTGVLTQLPSSPYATGGGSAGGTDPVSLGFFYNILTGPESWLGVVNKGADPGQTKNVANIAGFKVDSVGVPSGTSKAVVTLTAETSPSQLLTVTGNTAKKLFIGFLDQNQTQGSSLAGVYSYKILGNAGLSLINSAANPVDPPTLGLASNPAFRVLYAGFPTLNEVGLFSYNSTTGAVSFNAAFPNSGKGVGWMVVGPPSIGHGASFLYTAEPGSGTITVYSLSFDGTNLTQAQHFTLSGTTPSAGNLAFDPTGAFLYCLDSAHAMLHVLNIDQKKGTLTETNSPTAIAAGSGEWPLGLATGQF